MKAKIIIALFIIIGFNIWAQSYGFESYATDRLKLRAEPSLSALVLTVLPRYTGIHLLSEGPVETIDGITSKWINVSTSNGYSGWCFSGYVMKERGITAYQLEDLFMEYESGSFRGTRTKYEKFPGIESIDLIKANQGYYIQQQKRSFQGHGRAPEILKLLVIENRVFISEIDIINGNEIERSKLEFSFDGKTYSKGQSGIYQNDKSLVIRYLEHIPQKKWVGTWEYEEVYSFVARLGDKKPEALLQLTSDYLKLFCGDYIFESIDIVNDSESTDINGLARKTIIHVTFDSEQKCLKIPVHDLIDFLEPDNEVGDYDLLFIESAYTEPFFWLYGEGVGHSEKRYFFFDNGIGLRYETVGAELGKDLVVIRGIYQLVYVYFKKIS